MRKLKFRIFASFALFLASFIPLAVVDAANVAIPDILIGKVRGAQKGNGKISGGAGQKIRANTRPNGKGKFFFTAQNDETVFGDIRVTGTRKNKKFKITYKQIAPAADRGNKTAQMIRGGLLLEDVPSMGEAVFKAIAKSPRKFRDRKVRKTFTVKAADPTANHNSDSGKAKVIKK